MGFPGPGEDTEQTPSHCDTRVSTHRARGRHAPAPEDGGRGTLGRSPRMSEKTCRSVPGVPSRPPGRSTRQAHPRVPARPRPPTTLVPGASCRARGRTGHRHGSFRSTRGEDRGPDAGAQGPARPCGPWPGAGGSCHVRDERRRPAPVTELHGGWLPVVRCLLSELESRRELDRTPSTQVVCGTPAVPSEGRSPL